MTDLRVGDEVAFTADRLPLGDPAEVTAQTLWLAVLDLRIPEDPEAEDVFLDLETWPATEWLRSDRVIIRETALEESAG
ncbi:hypothetical protein AB0B10_25235 [Micromonospora arborensis]|uniref:hypothetical protein n=1 Tax=Micromonospora arborensis TaxID=2116518 RepID=UPI0033EBA29F